MSPSSIGIPQFLERYAAELCDAADEDYLAARRLHSANLRQQFSWCALQAVEKYIKVCFAFNGERILVSHDLCALFDRFKRLMVDKHGRTLRYPKYMEQFLFNLTRYGDNRYALSAAQTHGTELAELDETVWCIRRYCYWSTRLQFGGTDHNQQRFKMLNTDACIEAGSFERSQFDGLLARVLAADQNSREHDHRLKRIAEHQNAYAGYYAPMEEIAFSGSVGFVGLRSIHQWIAEGGQISSLEPYIPGVEEAYNGQDTRWKDAALRSRDILETGRTPVQSWIKVCPFSASRRAKVFHRRACNKVRKIVDKNRIDYETLDDAIADARTLATCCREPPAEPQPPRRRDHKRIYELANDIMNFLALMLLAYCLSAG